jgi:uncharacterized protein (DUF1684 family)
MGESSADTSTAIAPMKTKNIVILGGIVIVIVFIFYSFQDSQDDTTYIEAIKKERAENEHFMTSSKESPLKDKSEFTGLKYFPPDLKYKIIADLIPIQSKKVVTLNTNDGKEQRYIEYAYAEFNLDGVHNKLLILEGIDMGPIRGKLFLAFGDETSAVETYGAGRYLDVNKVPGSTTIVLDFNKAYNPYCAYNDTYSCPIPPVENLLKVPIKAGEKVYH